MILPLIYSKILYEYKNTLYKCSTQSILLYILSVYIHNLVYYINLFIS
jgi:hypothetical protein